MTRAAAAGTKARRMTAAVKRDTAAEPQIKVLSAPKSAAFPAGRMLIASPFEVQRIVCDVPRGRVITFRAIRDALAAEFRADYTCPVTTGIFLRIAADAAQEERDAGAAEVMPWWRVVRDDGSLLEKLPGGVVRQAKLLAAEGVAVERVRGILKRVAGVERVGWKPSIRSARSQ